MGRRSGRRAGQPRLLTPTFLLITFSTFAYFISVGALIPTLPRFVEGPLGHGSVAVGMSVGFFSLAAVLSRPITGRLGDQKGRRLLIVLGAAIVSVSVTAFTVAETLWILLILRFVSGAGEAFFYVGAASAINDLAPDERRGEALSYFSLALYAGLAVGPVLGESVLGDGRYDLVWFIAAGAAGIAAFLGTRVPDTRPEIVAPTAATSRFVHPAGLVPGVVLACNVWGLSGFNTFVPLYALALGMEGSRAIFVVYGAIVLSMRSLGARIPDRFGPRKTARAALTSTATGLAIIGVTGNVAGLFAGAAMFALGHSLIFPTLMTLAIRSAPASERGAVVGTFTAFFDLAYGLGAVTLGTVVAIFGYRGLFLVSAAMAVTGLVFLLKNIHHEQPVVEATA